MQLAAGPYLISFVMVTTCCTMYQPTANVITVTATESPTLVHPLQQF
jgi:hypothetical protein